MVRTGINIQNGKRNSKYLFIVQYIYIYIDLMPVQNKHTHTHIKIDNPPTVKVPAGKCINIYTYNMNCVYLITAIFYHSQWPKNIFIYSIGIMAIYWFLWKYRFDHNFFFLFLFPFMYLPNSPMFKHFQLNQIIHCSI